jgi:serine protease Do/serine protease DegQ
VVLDVAPGSPAEQAGLRAGDVITRIHSRPVANAGSVLATVGVAAPDSRLTVSWLRDGVEMGGEVQVRMATPQGVVMGQDRLLARGATLAAASGDVPGLRVESVESGSVAAAAGLRAGDLIVGVDGVGVADLAGASAALSPAGARALTVRRGEDEVQVTL